MSHKKHLFSYLLHPFALFVYSSSGLVLCYTFLKTAQNVPTEKVGFFMSIVYPLLFVGICILLIYTIGTLLASIEHIKDI